MITLAVAILCTAMISGWTAMTGATGDASLGYLAAHTSSMLVQLLVASMLLSYGLAVGPVTIP